MHGESPDSPPVALSGLSPAGLVERLYEARPLYVYPRALLDALLTRWDEVAPLLISRLERAIAETVACVARNDDVHDSDGPLLSVVLLGHRRELRGHTAVRSLLQIPTEARQLLIGDLAMEALDTALAATMPATREAADALLALAQQPGLAFDCRAAVLQSVGHAVSEGRLDRDAALAALAPLLDPAHPAIVSDRMGEDVSQRVVAVLVRLRATELRDALLKASEGFGLYAYMSPKDVNTELDKPPGDRLTLAYSRLVDRERLHDWLSSWASYAPRGRGTGAVQQQRRPGPKIKVLRAKKKKQRQMKKKSRKR